MQVWRAARRGEVDARPFADAGTVGCEEQGFSSERSSMSKCLCCAVANFEANVIRAKVLNSCLHCLCRQRDRLANAVAAFSTLPEPIRDRSESPLRLDAQFAYRRAYAEIQVPLNRATLDVVMRHLARSVDHGLNFAPKLIGLIASFLQIPM